MFVTHIEGHHMRALSRSALAYRCLPLGRSTLGLFPKMGCQELHITLSEARPKPFKGKAL
jgi:hypothetical protein